MTGKLDENQSILLKSSLKNDRVSGAFEVDQTEAANAKGAPVLSEAYATVSRVDEVLTDRTLSSTTYAPPAELVEFDGHLVNASDTKAGLGAMPLTTLLCLASSASMFCPIWWLDE
jgi:hypothetical protein